MDIAQIRVRAETFGQTLDATKRQLQPERGFWYPYGTLSNVGHLDRLLTGSHRFLLDLAGNERVADIGSADGDLAFFMESLGVNVDIIDHEPTNFNGLRGARLLKDALDSRVEIMDTDLDSQFQMPREKYGLVFFLGILYHLKNPFYALETLANKAHYCLVSTRITKFAPDKKTLLKGVPVAYLLDEREANNDPTNFWIFSDAGFRRLLKRTGWEVVDFMTVGNTTASDPSTAAGDERAFCLIRSQHVSR